MITNLVNILQTRSINNPAIPLSASSIIDYLGNQGLSTSGAYVNSDTALTYSPVWQAVTQISSGFAICPLELRRRQPSIAPNASVVEATHPLHLLVNDRPNMRFGRWKFWRRAKVHELIWNRAYIWIDKTRRGEVRGLYHLLPDRTAWDEQRGIYVSKIDGTPHGFFPSEIIELEGIQIANANECELVTKARESWGLGLAAQKFNSQFFNNGGQPGGILEIPATFTKKAADNLEAGWRNKYDVAGAGFRTAVLRDGAKFQAVTVNAEQNQMHEMRADQVYEVARWYNMPPSRLGLPDASSYNSKSEDNQAFLDMTIAPHLEATADECKLKLIDDGDRADLFFRHDTKPLLTLNRKARAEAHEVEIRSGQKSPNEARAEEDENPREGGDVYYVPANWAISNGQPPVSQGQPPAASDSPVAEMVSASIERELFAVITRVRKEIKRKEPGDFCKWWDENKQRLADYPKNNCAAGLKLLAAPIDITGFFSDIDESLELCTETNLRAHIMELCDQHAAIDWQERINGLSDTIQ